MKNSEIVKEILETLEKNHINLYHDVSKSTILEQISSIKNIDEIDDIQFDYEMLKLFALFKDAHTCYFVKWLNLDHKLLFIQNKFFLLNGEIWQEIESFGKLPSTQLFNKFKELISYETEAWLNHTVNILINNGYYYKMLGLLENDNVVIHLKNGINVDVSCKKVNNNSITQNSIRPYSYKILENNVLYLQYYRCKEIPEYPFQSFIEDIKHDIDSKKITKYILDLRENSGGNSEILNPFQDLVKNKKLKGVLLIDNGVFSSGRFAVARFKKLFNTKLIGEPTGGAAKSYGYSKRLNVGDKDFSVSIKLWDFSDVLGYEGSIQPDVFVPRIIEDIQKGIDKQLNVAIEELLPE